MKKYKFHIYVPEELDPGLVGVEDDVTIIVDSGYPGGEPGEFEQYMMEALNEWYDCARAATPFGKYLEGIKDWIDVDDLDWDVDDLDWEEEDV